MGLNIWGWKGRATPLIAVRVELENCLMCRVGGYTKLVEVQAMFGNRVEFPNNAISCCEAQPIFN